MGYSISSFEVLLDQSKNQSNENKVPHSTVVKAYVASVIMFVIAICKYYF